MRVLRARLYRSRRAGIKAEQPFERAATAGGKINPRLSYTRFYPLHTYANTQNARFSNVDHTHTLYLYVHVFN